MRSHFSAFPTLAAARHRLIDIIDELPAQARMYFTRDHIDGFPLRERDEHGIGRAHSCLVSFRLAQLGSRHCPKTLY